MRHVLRMLVAVTSVLTVASPVSAGPAHTAVADQAFVEQMLYTTPMSGFVASVGSDPWFDWSTDFCSAPLVGNTGRSFNFTKSCRRHDFGYRNLHRIEARYGVDEWNSANRLRVDRQFLTDMRNHCHARPWYDQPTCLAWAETFYAAVRIGGGL
jgi:Prokaryotic phospholipase A2